MSNILEATDKFVIGRSDLKVHEPLPVPEPAEKQLQHHIYHFRNGTGLMVHNVINDDNWGGDVYRIETKSGTVFEMTKRNCNYREIREKPFTQEEINAF